ncbi:hypothetical protein PB2503_00922 [Parvularcula bermudensis HTCC2503]|uniref:Class II aldolase/adducin N-terminal domain-containing protein n=1 Tax=Parvularcula bermudensis (strain ATCC BAA-594 / HTCC2503 / KCTC 12087) TaxID=314260 RepID=E0TB61_PARBH|nr:hypothetical protein PB2503_00922 [Parvularcula bermudensis HTCC2503]
MAKITPQEIDPASLPSVKGIVTEEEWRLRCELAATYRLVALFGWDDLVFTHISVRLPEMEGHPRFLINPYGVLFEEMTASALLTIDLDGRKIDESPYQANPAGFVIHSAIHGARHDAGAVLHLHSPYGVAVAAQEGGLGRYSQFAMQVHDDLAYHDYEGIATNTEERARLVADMGDRSFLILRNHGTLTTGPNCAIAFLRMYFLERACHAQILAQAGGTLRDAGPDLAQLVGRQSQPAWAPGIGDKLVWPGLMRRLARTNPGWDR